MLFFLINLLSCLCLLSCRLKLYGLLTWVIVKLNVAWVIWDIMWFRIEFGDFFSTCRKKLWNFDGTIFPFVYGIFTIFHKVIIIFIEEIFSLPDLYWLLNILYSGDTCWKGVTFFSVCLVFNWFFVLFCFEQSCCSIKWLQGFICEFCIL